MTEQKTPKKIEPKKLIILSVVLALVCLAIVLGGQYVNNLVKGHTAEEQQQIADELIRTKDFISDWYDELVVDGKPCDVYLNELRFAGGTYTLTFAGKRLRAVYPRGNRFFKMDFIDNAEFFQAGGKIRCRLHYWGTNEYTFALN